MLSLSAKVVKIFLLKCFIAFGKIGCEICIKKRKKDYTYVTYLPFTCCFTVLVFACVFGFQTHRQNRSIVLIFFLNN